METPLLSIGIIFRNEIRCLERCLKSLQPLRDALPCELVMADTGADDGSREIAENYADILFDFPWINDFSAARNALIDRCSGKWYMSIDCDEWIDSNIEGFVTFLTTDEDYDFGSVIIRNYRTPDLSDKDGFGDFIAVRLLRLSSGVRYEGTIHEHWPYDGDLHTMLIRDAIFGHDGYIYQDPTQLKAKQKRNLELLHKQLKDSPNNLIVLTQCVESSEGLPEQEDHLRRALAGTAEHWPQWELFGPVIYRYAVRLAIKYEMPELEQWIAEAEERFPASIYVRVEVAYFAFGHYWEIDDFPEAIRWGEMFLQGVKDYKNGNFNRAEQLASSLEKTDIHSYLSVATVLASGYLHVDRPEECVRLMDELNPAEMQGKQLGDCLNNLFRLRGEFGWDTDALVCRMWNSLDQLPPKEDKGRKEVFMQVGAAVFTRAHREGELTEPRFHAHSYTVFLPLAGKCSLGDAAVILEQSEPEVLEKLLRKVEHWDETPIQALTHALEQGARFPLPDKPLNIEAMDALAARLAADRERFLPIVKAAAQSTDRRDGQGLAWLRGLVLAAVQSFPWNAEEPDEEDGLALAWMLAQVEKEFLPRCYAADALTGDGLFLLPPLHRFGFYCAQAFNALDAGDGAGYVRLLREGLETCESVKPMVEFLLDHTPELQAKPAPSAELKALADQVRAVLAQFSPDDPAVAALKQSEAYQKVAYLIEGIDVPVVGGLKQ